MLVHQFLELFFALGHYVLLKRAFVGGDNRALNVEIVFVNQRIAFVGRLPFAFEVKHCAFYEKRFLLKPVGRFAAHPILIYQRDFEQIVIAVLPYDLPHHAARHFHELGIGKLYAENARNVNLAHLAFLNVAEFAFGQRDIDFCRHKPAE